MAESDEKFVYIVKEGKVFGASGEYPAGSEVELTEAEASGFPDLLEPADRKHPIKLKNELNVHVAPEYKVLTEKPKAKKETPPKGSESGMGVSKS